MDAAVRVYLSLLISAVRIVECSSCRCPICSDADWSIPAGRVLTTHRQGWGSHRGRATRPHRRLCSPRRDSRATTTVLTSFVKGSIVPQGATIHTDAWAAYKALTKMGIDHRPRKSGHGRHVEDGLPSAHTVFGNLKIWLRGAYHGVSPKHLQRYLNEFQFRFNKRWHEADLFSPVLQAAIDADPFPYRHLTSEQTG